MRLKMIFSAVLFRSFDCDMPRTDSRLACRVMNRLARAAESSAQPVLIHFHAWYCGPCQRMDREVFADLQVQQALTDGMASVKVDVTHEPDLASRCGATSVPRDVVMFPDGTIETLNVGYMQKSQYLNLLRDISERGKQCLFRSQLIRRRQCPIVSKGEPANACSGSRTQSETRTILPPSCFGSIPNQSIDPPLIGLEGFCPVLLHDKREWTAGNEKITADYRGVRYVFSSEANRDEFLKNPSLYAPQDLGCDAVVLTDTQRAVTGSIRFGAFFDDRLYLFQSPENRERIQAEPTEIRANSQCLAS